MKCRNMVDNNIVWFNRRLEAGSSEKISSFEEFFAATANQSYGHVVFYQLSDSEFLAYDRQDPDRNGVLFKYDTASKQTTELASGLVINVDCSEIYPASTPVETNVKAIFFSRSIQYSVLESGSVRANAVGRNTAIGNIWQYKNDFYSYERYNGNMGLNQYILKSTWVTNHYKFDFYTNKKMLPRYSNLWFIGAKSNGHMFSISTDSSSPYDAYLSEWPAFDDVESLDRLSAHKLTYEDGSRFTYSLTASPGGSNYYVLSPAMQFKIFDDVIYLAVNSDTPTIRFTIYKVDENACVLRELFHIDGKRFDSMFKLDDGIGIYYRIYQGGGHGARFIWKYVPDKITSGDNYVDKQQGVAVGLRQRLSVIKGELWYNINYGLPLLDKIKSKTILDMKVLSIVTAHQDVISVNKFESNVDRHSYHCKMEVITKYGSVNLQM